MAEENLSKEFRLNNIDGTRNYLIEKKKMSWWVESTKRFVQF